MQRLARTQIEQINLSAVEVFQHYDELIQIIRRHLPPSNANLLARPRVIQSENPIVEWYSDLEGQPILLTNASRQKAQLEQANTLISQRLNAIAGLRNELVQKNAISSVQAKLLSQFVDGASHNTRQVYLINNEPVIAGWGIGKTPEPPKPAQPATPPPVVTPSRKHHWCCCLLPLLLLLLLLAALLWWLYFRPNPIATSYPMSPMVSEKMAESAMELAAKPVPEPKSEQVVESELEPEPELESVPKPEETPLESSLGSEELQPEPQSEIPLKEEVPPEPVKTCVEDMALEERPQMVMVFDDSFSMLYSLKESNAAIDAFQNRAQMIGVTREEERYMQREPNRISEAKKSAVAIVDKIESGIDVGLVTLKRCPNAINHGMFSTNKRKALKKKIRALMPRESESNLGTALYKGLQQAANMVDGVNRDAFILLLSDGEDNCPGESNNVCALASILAKQKPRLKINVVNIGGTQAANCVANATNGKVFTANNQSQLIKMINQASKPVEKSQGCK